MLREDRGRDRDRLEELRQRAREVVVTHADVVEAGLGRAVGEAELEGEGVLRRHLLARGENGPSTRPNSIELVCYIPPGATAPRTTRRMIRMGPFCYSRAAPRAADGCGEMNFFVEEGMCDEEGHETYQLIPESHAPFTFERDTLWQTMKERGIDLTMDTKPSTIAHSRIHGKPLYVIAGWRNQQPFYVMAQPEIESLADLAGKRIGIIDLDDVLATMISYHLQEAGVDLDNVDWVTQTDTRRGPAALREKRVESVFVDRDRPSPGPGGGEPARSSTGRRCIRWTAGLLHRRHGQALEERPEEVLAFLRAMIRAYWFLRTMPDNVHVTMAVEKRLRRWSPDPDEPKRMAQFGSAEHAERMPFPVDGNATGFEQYLRRRSR